MVINEPICYKPITSISNQLMLVSGTSVQRARFGNVPTEIPVATKEVVNAFTPAHQVVKGTYIDKAVQGGYGGSNESGSTSNSSNSSGSPQSLSPLTSEDSLSDGHRQKRHCRQQSQSPKARKCRKSSYCKCLHSRRKELIKPQPPTEYNGTDDIQAFHCWSVEAREYVCTGRVCKSCQVT
jgi:hypothetical protein